jgi:hypothetical protein
LGNLVVGMGRLTRMARRRNIARRGFSLAQSHRASLMEIGWWVGNGEAWKVKKSVPLLNQSAVKDQEKDSRPTNQEAAAVAREERLARQAGVGAPPVADAVQASAAVVLQVTMAPPAAQETKTTAPALTPTQELPQEALVQSVETVEEEPVAQAAEEDADATGHLILMFQKSKMTGLTWQLILNCTIRMTLRSMTATDMLQRGSGVN